MDGYDRAIAWTKIAKSVHRPMEEDRDDDRDRDAVRSMRIQRSSVVHVSQGEPLISSLTCVLNARV